VKPKSDNSALIARIDRVFDRSKELPGDVFRIQGRNWFFDGHRMFTVEIWEALNELSRLYGDSEIALVVDDPDDYDLATWGSPPVHSFPAPGPPDPYNEAMWANYPEASPIIFIADIMYAAGNSGCWGVMAERGVVGVVRTTGNYDFTRSIDTAEYFCNVQDAKDDILAVYLGPETERFHLELSRNYE
jgi:hypothetical protein